MIEHSSTLLRTFLVASFSVDFPLKCLYSERLSRFVVPASEQEGLSLFTLSLAIEVWCLLCNQLQGEAMKQYEPVSYCFPNRQR